MSTTMRAGRDGGRGPSRCWRRERLRRVALLSYGRPVLPAFVIAVFAVLGCQRSKAPDVAIDELAMDIAPFATVVGLRPSETALALPPHETVASYPANSPRYHSTELAVAADGTIAIGDPRSCSILLLADTGRHMRRIEACADTGRGIDDLFWVDRDLLGLFDMRSREVRLLGRHGEDAGRVPVEPVQSGVITAAFPLPADKSILAAVGFFSLSGRERFVQLHDSGGTPKAAFLSAPAVALRPDLRLAFGVELCLRQSPRPGAARFLAINRWAHDVVMAVPDDSAVAFRSLVPMDAYMYRDENDLLAPSPGRVAVACGEDSGLAHRTVLRSRPDGGTETNGVLDWISFTGGLIARFDLGSAPLFARSREIGIDSADRAYALVRDSSDLRVIRHPLARPPEIHEK